MPHFGEQRAVRGDVDLKPFFVTDVEQLIDLGVQQRLAFDMEINIVRMRLDVVQNFAKILHLDKLRLAMGRRTEAASQIADAGRFDIELFKFFHADLLRLNFSYCLILSMKGG